MSSEQGKTVSPFSGLDYRDASGPANCAAVGSLALNIVALTASPGVHALAAAILIDQGRCVEALDLLNKAAADAAEEAETRRQKALDRKATQ